LPNDALPDKIKKDNLARYCLFNRAKVVRAEDMGDLLEYKFRFRSNERCWLVLKHASQQPIEALRKENHMAWTIAVVLIIPWLLGMVSSYTMSGMIHILPCVCRCDGPHQVDSGPMNILLSEGVKSIEGWQTK
jgi:hypothetical protein